MTRNGKIARLPVSIRGLLNQRLRDGESGVRLVGWLNGLPKVQEVMQEKFSGRPVNEQNLSEWKQGGYEDWLRHQEECAWVRSLAEESAALEEEAGDVSVADWLSATLGVALGRWVQRAAAGAEHDGEEERLRLKRERWDAEQDQRREQESEKIRTEIAKIEARGDFYNALLIHLDEERRKKGPISAEEEERHREISRRIEEWRRYRQTVGSHRFGWPFPAESGQIKPNQADADSESSKVSK